MNDDELLRQLAEAFAPEPSAPPAAGLQALHRSLDAARGVRPQRRRARKRWLVPAFATITALGVGNLALAAAGTTLPRVVREVAHDVNLPVDSPALLDTRRDSDALRVALDRGDLSAIETQARKVRAAFARLDSGERKTVAANVEQLLARADSGLEEADEKDQATSTTLPSATPEVTSDPDVETEITETDEGKDGESPPSTQHATTDTSGTDDNTGSEGHDSGENQGDSNGQNVDDAHTDSGQQNNLADQGGANSEKSSEGDSPD